ncbi:Por secretion system C-terminal sorting domain-containing protein [Cruoricaptor ignavus]|uniref:Por secretion system C-terminal sorting domain-containing protein n=1 Tax=Cruoricaptor ignavus TaxID=1118202 RepID=A0A1M6A2S2_9FLAO|nr:choice-of-anchor J domain-containing protein [Cruoricaptor ignavus]SHI30756.1 Por secretion system C-terminal sorting domain-containing protein [Cruoricaptor ignavus]
MKKNLLAAAMLVFGAKATAQVTLFEDNVEGHEDFIIANIGKYTLIDNDKMNTYYGGVDNNTASWPNVGKPMVAQVFNPNIAGVVNGHGNEQSNFDPHSGDKYFAFWGGVPQPAAGVLKNDDWLVLPKITLGTGNKFSFWVKSLASDFGLEKYRVAIMDGSGAAPTTSKGFVAVGGTRQAPTTWTEVTVDIPATYDEKPVYLAINYISADVYMMLVDDLKVTTQTLGTSETGKAKAAVYPNPSKGLFTVKSDKKVLSTEVYSVDGKLVKTAAENVDITASPKGVYILKVKYADGTTESKQVIKN